MPYIKAVVVGGPEAVDGKLVFRVMVDGLLVTLSSYKALATDSDRGSLQMAGQAISPGLYAMAQSAVMAYVAADRTGCLERAFHKAKDQIIRIPATAKNAELVCPRCQQGISRAPADAMITCSRCGSSMLLQFT